MTTLTVADILMRALGAFYVFAGVVGTRAALTSQFIDTVMAALDGGKAPAAERRKSVWLIASTALVFASGVALMAGLDVARWLFLASAAGQALYLYALAPLYFDKVDAPDPGGRRQTTNAFVVYVAATALVWWAWATGRLVAISDAPPWVLALAGAASAAYAAYVARQLLWRGG
jgi:hypothetical protein